MVGNHDWYYHLKGEAFDAIRAEIIRAMGLSNPPTPFPFDLQKLDPGLPWEEDDAPAIRKLFEEYRVFARHGDMYDSFNFDRELGRDNPTLGDALAMEVINKYPETLKRIPGLDPEIVDKLRQITNVRPALATPLWVSHQLRMLARANMLNEVSEKELKEVWDRLAGEFLELDFVRRKDKSFKFDIVDKLQAAVKLSSLVSFETIEKLTLRLYAGKRPSNRSFSRYALEEPAFLDHSARFFVYGHTHHHETIPLDYDEVDGHHIYFNSGTWHTYYDLARKNPNEKKFVPYKALTYITFYKPQEHDGRSFETWSGAYA
jgi:DNA-binding TFAR19-related protein (PDSD5 family)